MRIVSKRGKKEPVDIEIDLGQFYDEQDNNTMPPNSDQYELDLDEMYGNVYESPLIPDLGGHP